MQTKSASGVNGNSISPSHYAQELSMPRAKIKKQEVIKYCFNFGKAIEDRLVYYKSHYPKQTAKIFFNNEVTTLRKNTEKARKKFQIF